MNNSWQQGDNFFGLFCASQMDVSATARFKRNEVKKENAGKSFYRLRGGNGRFIGVRLSRRNFRLEILLLTLSVDDKNFWFNS